MLYKFRDLVQEHLGVTEDDIRKHILVVEEDVEAVKILQRLPQMTHQ